MDLRYIFFMVALIQGIHARSALDDRFALELFPGGIIEADAKQPENTTAVLPSSYDECLKLSSVLEDSFNLMWSIVTWGFQASQKLGSDIMSISDCGAMSVTCFKTSIDEIKKDLKSIRPSVQNYETQVVKVYQDFRAHLSACF